MKRRSYKMVAIDAPRIANTSSSVVQNAIPHHLCACSEHQKLIEADVNSLGRIPAIVFIP